MNYRIVIAVLICLAVTGCRRSPHMDAYLDMLNAEKRVLEDRLYELEYDYEQALEELEAVRAQDGAEGESPQVDDDEPTEEPDALPEIQLPPGFDEGADDAAGGTLLRSTSTAVDGRRIETGNRDSGHGSAADAVADKRVEYIYINPRLTKSEDFDSRPGDDGLTVMIEPRNKNGQFVPKPAPVAIVLLDPSKRDEAARYARWDFEEEVSRKVLRTGTLDRGFHFRVPWPETPPDGDRLHLFVRYTAEDGRKLEADREITVRLPQRAATSWSARHESTGNRTAARHTKVGHGQREAPPTPTTVRAVYEREIESPRASPSN
jgi:hypothetical protein